VTSTLVFLTAEDDEFEIIQLVVTVQPIRVEKPVAVKQPKKQKRADRPPIPKLKVEKTESIVEENLALVTWAVDRIKLKLPAHVDPDDLFSVGVRGLMAACERYDAAKVKTFRSYATMRINGAILDELRRMDWIPRRARARSRKLKKAEQDVEQKLGRSATQEEVANHLELTPKEMQKWVDEAKPVTFIAIDQPAVGDEGPGSALHETIADDNVEVASENMERDETIKLMMKFIDVLSPIMQRVVRSYYFEGMRLWEVAESIGLTESRICQIRREAIDTLRTHVMRHRDR
jgi:RNA polymerase sigma factor FliA